MAKTLRYVLLLMVSYALHVSAYNLTGYDCTDPLTNYTAISTHEVKECKDDTLTSDKTESPVYILYRNDYSYIPVHICTLKRHTLITRCGMWSHISNVRDGFKINEDVRLSAEECDVIRRRNVYITQSGRRVEGIIMNTTMNFQDIDVGFLDTEGKCSGGDVTFEGQSYSNVVRQRSYTLTIQERYLPYSYELRKLITPEGYRMVYEPLTAVVGSSRYTWDKDIDTNSCHGARYTRLYDGIASHYRSHMGSGFYIIDNDEFSFAIISNEPTFVCNIAMKKTSNNRVFVVDDSKTIPLARAMARDTNAPIDLDLIMDLKLFYIEENTRNRTTELYRTIYNEMCAKNLLYLRSLLSLATTAPEEFAWIYMRDSGYTAVLRGEVIYLIKCMPKVVELREDPNCH